MVSEPEDWEHELMNAAEDEGTRSVGFPGDEPIDMTLSIITGKIDVRLGARTGTFVTVTPLPSDDWFGGFGGVLTWVGQQMGGASTLNAGFADAVRRCDIDFRDGELSVRASRQVPLSLVPLHIVVDAPENSNIQMRSGATTLTVTGRAGRVRVGAGSGDLRLDAVAGSSQLETGTGTIRIDAVDAPLRARSGAGSVLLGEVNGSSTVFTGGGRVQLDTVSADCMVRTGHGDIGVDTARRGRIELSSGSGDLRIGLARDTLAEIDLQSSTGTVRSELTVDGERPEAESVVSVRARTGSGQVLLAKAE
jgi:hypothetical protein